MRIRIEACGSNAFIPMQTSLSALLYAILKVLFWSPTAFALRDRSGSLRFQAPGSIHRSTLIRQGPFENFVWPQLQNSRLAPFVSVEHCTTPQQQVSVHPGSRKVKGKDANSSV